MLRNIREAVSYIAEHRGKTIVVKLDDKIDPTDVIEDIALLTKVGMRIAIVAQQQLVTPENFRIITDAMEICESGSDGVYRTIMSGKIAVVIHQDSDSSETDDLAERLAEDLKASKLVFATNVQGIFGESRNLIGELSLDEAKLLLQGKAAKGGIRKKLQCAIAACEKGVNRVHIIGSYDDALIGELLTSQGVGTMIYNRLYHCVRPARYEDLAEIRDILAKAELRQSLFHPGKPSFQLEQMLERFLVFVSDDHVHGCAMIDEHHEWRALEILYLCESTAYERSHTPMRALVQEILERARQGEYPHLFLCENRNLLWLETFEWFTKDFQFRRKNLGETVPTMPDLVWYRNTVA